MGRVIDFYLDDNYIRDYFEKRNEVNRLSNEVEIMSGIIKDQLHRNGMLYAATDNYNIYLKQVHKVDDKFILLLKKNNMESFITQSCTMKILDLASNKMGINKNDYTELWYNRLMVNKKQ